MESLVKNICNQIRTATSLTEVHTQTVNELYESISYVSLLEKRDYFILKISSVDILKVNLENIIKRFRVYSRDRYTAFRIPLGTSFFDNLLTIEIQRTNKIHRTQRICGNQFYLENYIYIREIYQLNLILYVNFLCIQ